MHPLLETRTAGVLLHPTSLPTTGGAIGIGDLGPAARGFVDWMSAAGLRRWQMLPIGPVGEGDSPYSPLSSFAIEPMLASVADLVRDGLLPRSALRTTDVPTGRNASWRSVRRWKTPRLQAAFERFRRTRGRTGPNGRRYLEFHHGNSDWLDPWCEFAAANARPSATAIEREPAFHAFVQFVLDRQWDDLRRYAATRDVHLVGDLPIFCGADSADVAARPDLFRLDRDGRPKVQTGCPPDAFARNGQLWRHPHYRWASHRRDGFAWWRRRVETTMHRFDLVRIDHFIGFVRAYEIPGDATHARDGRWGRSPGRDLLEAIRADWGVPPFIAEDLGDVTPAVHRLRDDFDLPGMRILQWAFFDEDATSGDLPHRHPEHAVVYPGTHDNDTIAGWHRDLPSAARSRFHAYAGEGSRRDPAAAMTRLAFTSPANTTIVQMQDLLGLGRSARMNVPGRPRGNWRWRLQPNAASAALARDLRALSHASGRLGRPN